MLSDALLHKAFFTLLCSGLWRKNVDTTYFPLNHTDWELLFQFSRKQTVEGIVYDGILSLPVDLFPPKLLMLRWAVVVDALEDVNGRMNRQVGAFSKFFEENGVEAYLLKGQGVASLYDVPGHRVCGDIDWFFPQQGGYEKANSLIANKKIHIRKSSGFSSEYQYGHFQVEHHQRLLDIHNPFSLRKLRPFIQREYLKKMTVNVGWQGVVIPSPMLSHLVGTIHILKHSLSFGIGLRQLCDSARICSAYKDQVDGEELKQIYTRMKVYRWMQVLNQLLVDCLQLDEASLPFALDRKDNPDWLLNEIWEAGNFGFADIRFGDNYQAYKKRSHSFKHWCHRFKLNVGYAPAEAISFPLMQIYSRITKMY